MQNAKTIFSDPCHPRLSAAHLSSLPTSDNQPDLPRLQNVSHSTTQEWEKTLFFDTLEPRQHFTADIAVGTSRLLFSGVKNKTTASQTIVITNAGDSTLKIGTGGLSIGGTDYNKFALSSPPSLPKSIAPGATLSIKVVFKPTVAGVKSATLKIKSNDSDTPTLPITLRGLGANGLYDS